MGRERQVFLQYIKERKQIIKLGITLFGLWCLYSYLSGASLENVVYLTALWVFVVAIYAAWDYAGYRKRYFLLEHMREKIRVSVEYLPEPKSIFEEQYQILIQTIFEDKMEQLARENQTRDDLVEYFTMWAHQIKTPIAGMGLLLQMSEFLEKEELKEELFRIEQYVDMVLIYLRLDADGNDLVIQSYDVEKIVKKAVRTFAGQFIRKKLSVEVSAVSGQVITDEKWFRFVVEQLLSNAIKYTDEGGVVISWQENILCIADTGMGIASEDLPRIFEKGYTGYNGRMDKRSTGIGLYLCYQTMQKLGGSIWVESEIGKGTKFYLKFPDDVSIYE